MSNLVKISPDITVGIGSPLLLVAGPCQIESLEHCLLIANRLKEICKEYATNLVFKASFDKANRTSLAGKRGPGIQEGLEILKEVKEITGLPVLTDIHTAEQATLAAEVVDILQIPAFLCRQTDLLIAAGETNKPINVKKGQFLPPEDMKYVSEKIESTGNNNIMLCERGSSFGYRDLVVDMRGLVIMRSLGYPVIFDGTHSVQSLGGSEGTSGGSREFIPYLVNAATATGIDGLFLECHENPDSAPSDSASMLHINKLDSVLSKVFAIRKIVNNC